MSCDLELLLQFCGTKSEFTETFLALAKFKPGFCEFRSEFLKMIPGATRRVLNVQLNQLEVHGLVSKKIFAELPPKVEYFLTDIGKAALPVIVTLGQWGEVHQDHLRDKISEDLA